jgi:hypothetical protein
MSYSEMEARRNRISNSGIMEMKTANEITKITDEELEAYRTKLWVHFQIVKQEIEYRERKERE